MRLSHVRPQGPGDTALTRLSALDGRVRCRRRAGLTFGLGLGRSDGMLGRGRLLAALLGLGLIRRGEAHDLPAVAVRDRGAGVRGSAVALFPLLLLPHSPGEPPKGGLNASLTTKKKM